MTFRRRPRAGAHWYLTLAVAATVALPVRAPASAEASANQFAMFGETPLLLSDPSGTMATLRSLGVNVVRVSLRWQALAPRALSRSRPRGFDASDPAAYPAAKLNRYDELVRRAQADGIAIEFVLTGGAPRWATGRGAPRGGPYLNWKPSAREFGLFAQAMATRYSGHFQPRRSRSPLPAVHFWEIWNEPNFGQNLAPQAINGSTVSTSPVMYRALVEAGWRALQRTGHGRDTILIGNLSPRGFNSPPGPRFPNGLPGDFSTTKPLQFIRTLYCVDSSFRQLRGRAARAVGCPVTSAGSRRFRAENTALFLARGFGIHPYPFNLPPNEADSKDPDYVEFSEIPRLVSSLDRLERVYGSSRRPLVYVTEFGYITNPPNTTAHYGTHFLSPATAAVYLNWAEYLSWRNPSIASTMQYLLYDPSPNASGFATGLIFDDGQLKPTFDAYRMPLFLPVGSTQRGHKIDVWGCVRPARYANIETHGATQYVQIQFRRGRRGPFRTIKTVAITNVRGYFDVRVAIPASGGVRLAWSYPTGQAIVSRTATVTVR
jgi:hypothetical protein